MEKWVTAIANKRDLEQFSELRQEISDIFVREKGHSASEGALQGYFLSRLALQRAFQLCGVSAPWHEFSWSNFGQLKMYPEWRCSLSHTKGLAMALLQPASLSPSVGVDIEWRERSIPEGGEKYFINIEDNLSWTPMELWTIKEATFKALSPVCPELKMAKDIIISKNNFTYRNVSGKFQLLRAETLCTVAFVGQGMIS